MNPKTAPISYAQDKEYKLYNLGIRKGFFYHFTVDPEEANPIYDNQLSPAQVAIKKKLQKALSQVQLWFGP